MRPIILLFLLMSGYGSLFAQEQTVRLNFQGDSTAQFNQHISIPVCASGIRNINSLQFTVHWDPHILEFEGIDSFARSAGLSIGDIGLSAVKEGKLFFIHTNADPLGFSMEEGDTLFRLQFKGVGLPRERTILGIENYPLEREAFGVGVTRVFETSRKEIRMLDSEIAARLRACWSQDSFSLQQEVVGRNFPWIWTLSNLQGDIIFRRELCSNGIYFSKVPTGTYINRIRTAEEDIRDTIQLQITDPLELKIRTVGGTCPQTADGQIFIDDIQGGQPPYTIVWPDGSLHYPNFIDVRPGMYQVAIKDALGCVDTTNIELEGNEVVVREEKENTACPGIFSGRLNVDVFNLPRFEDSTLLFSLNGTNFFRNERLTVLRLDGGNLLYFIQDTTGCIYERETEILFDNEIILQNENRVDPTCLDTEDGGISLSAALTTNVPGDFQFDWENESTPVPTVQDSFFQIDGIPTGDYVLNIRHTGLESRCVLRKTFELGASDSVAIVLDTLRNESCLGMMDGEIILRPFGNLLDYDILWQTGDTSLKLEGLAPGRYDVRVENENGCVNRDTFDILQGAEVGARLLENVNVNCPSGADGRLSIDPYSSHPDDFLFYTLGLDSNLFIGNDTLRFNNLRADTYQLTIQNNNGCRFDTLIIVEETPLFEVVLEEMDSANCAVANGRLRVRGLPRDSNYQYFWEHQDTGVESRNLRAGQYYLRTLNSRGCLRLDTFVVNERGKPRIRVDQKVEPRCFGDNEGLLSVVIENGLVPIDSLRWSTGSDELRIDSLNAGIYSIVVVDTNGCIVMDSFEIQEPDSIILTFYDIMGSSTDSMQGSAKVRATGGVPPYSYVWSTDPIQSDSIANGLDPIFYEVLVVDGNRCLQRDSVRIPFPTAVDNDLQREVRLYPNPTSGQIRILSESASRFDIRIFDTMGNQVMRKDGYPASTEMDISFLKSGMYFFYLRLHENQKEGVFSVFLKQ